MRSGGAWALAVMAAAALPAAAAPPPGYTIALPERIELAAGQGGEVSLTIAPQAGYTISRSGPLRVSLSARPADAVSCRAAAISARTRPTGWPSRRASTWRCAVCARGATA